MNVINFHVTNSCNYHCTYCFGKFPETKELNLEQACAVVDNIQRHFAKNGIDYGRINLAGGEPLLYRHLDELIDYINACGIKVSIITNGSLLTEERIATWKGKIYCIGLSLDSALPDKNIEIGRCCKNKPLTIKQAVRITQAMHRNGIMLKINTVVSRLNVNEDMTVFYKRLKPDRLKFLQVEIVKGINSGADKYKISKQAFDEFCKRHENCCKNVVCEPLESMENSYLMINPQGDFLLNNSGKYQTYGNCLEEKLTDILVRVPFQKEKFNTRYEKIREEKSTKKRICVFGGHETWIKSMKMRLKGVRFIRRGDLHSDDVIRNSDEIWIQPNAISHSFYGRVIEAARTNKIPVFYFSYVSAQKCFEQVKLT